MSIIERFHSFRGGCPGIPPPQKIYMQIPRVFRQFDCLKMSSIASKLTNSGSGQFSMGGGGREGGSTDALFFPPTNK